VARRRRRKRMMMRDILFVLLFTGCGVSEDMVESKDI
jgi:hypothetical protein